MLAAGRARCPALHRDMEIAAGALAGELLAVLSVFLVTIGNSSRRRLAVGHPICRHRTLDEAAVLALIAARQSGDGARVAAHLRWLVLPERREAVAKALAAFADVAGRAGLRLAPPRQYMRPMRESGVLSMVSVG